MRKRRHKHRPPPASAKPTMTSAPAPAPAPIAADVADLRREPPEPVAIRGSIPIWLIAAVVLLFYCADMYVVTHGADLGGEAGAFPVTVYDPYNNHRQVVEANPVDPARKQFLQGRIVFGAKACVTCHTASGLGVAGQFPPLAGSEWVLTENPARAIRIVLNGLTGPITVSGQAFNNSMPPLGLTDEEAANVLTYIRNEWGNKAPPVKPEQVAKVRQEIGGKADMFTVPELEQVPEGGQ